MSYLVQTLRTQYATNAYFQHVLDIKLFLVVAGLLAEEHLE